jgi:hypothetical protein
MDRNRHASVSAGRQDQGNALNFRAKREKRLRIRPLGGDRKSRLLFVQLFIVQRVYRRFAWRDAVVDRGPSLQESTARPPYFCARKRRIPRARPSAIRSRFSAWPTMARSDLLLRKKHSTRMAGTCESRST